MRERAKGTAPVRAQLRWKLTVGLIPAWAAAATIGLTVGCGPKEEPTLREMPVATDAEEAVPEGDYRGEALDALAESLEAKATALPGPTPEEHRAQMHAFFADVVEVLPILEGPEPSGAFRQQLRAVRTARDRLAPDAGTMAAEPTIDTGLRGVYAALNAIGRDEAFAGQRMSTVLAELEAKVDELDRVRSVGRSYVAADAARLVAATVRHMADRLAGRVTDTPTTGPTEPPLVPPGAIDPPKPTIQPKPPTTPTEETPTEETPTEETPAEETPAEETPTEETPAEEMPAEETPAEEEAAPSEEAPAEEMPAEEAP